MYRKLFKRIIDLLIAIAAFLVLSPVILVVATLLLISNKGNPFFFQVRPGKDEKLFSIIKFRTMNFSRDANGVLLPDHQRLTAVGRIIRKTSLDELPQLINVIVGDMSLIGPRPLLPQYLPLYTDIQRRRHEIRPGITGWAQINGRNAISWKQKFDLDVYYVDHYSFSMDLNIIYLTFVKVFKSEGVNASEQKTMDAFNGRN